jgi:ComF family protein
MVGMAKCYTVVKTVNQLVKFYFIIWWFGKVLVWKIISMLMLCKIVDWLLPTVCVLCGGSAAAKVNINEDADTTYASAEVNANMNISAASNYNLCRACVEDLPLLSMSASRLCCYCGRDIVGLDEAGGNEAGREQVGWGQMEQSENQCGKIVCGHCLREPPPYERTISLYRYQSPIDHLILGLKFGNKLIYAQLLGRLLAEYLQRFYAERRINSGSGCVGGSGDEVANGSVGDSNGSRDGRIQLPELIVPIPLHRQRLCERGYNQAIELARPIARHLNIPLDYSSCARAKHTQAQSLLRAAERKYNMRNAFVVARPERLQGRWVAVLDDVITTGNTVHEFCRKLKDDGGVRQIDVWSCARAIGFP